MPLVPLPHLNPREELLHLHAKLHFLIQSKGMAREMSLVLLLATLLAAPKLAQPVGDPDGPRGPGGGGNQDQNQELQMLLQVQSAVNATQAQITQAVTSFSSLNSLETQVNQALSLVSALGSLRKSVDQALDSVAALNATVNEQLTGAIGVLSGLSDVQSQDGSVGLALSSLNTTASQLGSAMDLISTLAAYFQLNNNGGGGGPGFGPGGGP